MFLGGFWVLLFIGPMAMSAVGSYGGGLGLSGSSVEGGKHDHSNLSRSLFEKLFASELL